MPMAVVAAAPPMTSFAEGMCGASSRPGWTERLDSRHGPSRLGARSARHRSGGPPGAAGRGGPAAGSPGDLRAVGGGRVERDRPEAQALQGAGAGAPAAPPAGGRTPGGPLRRRLVEARLGRAARAGLDRTARARARRPDGEVPALRRGAAAGPVAAAGTAAVRVLAGGGLMRAVLLEAPGTPLRVGELPPPEPGPGEVLLEVSACGVCRTDLHIVDGELDKPKLPLVLGHQIVGRVAGDGRRVGVPWLGWTCGECRYCTSGRENLCDRAQFTGYDRDGGYAEYTVADARFCFPIPEGFPDLAAAPLLCAGLIGYRTL